MLLKHNKLHEDVPIMVVMKGLGLVADEEVIALMPEGECLCGCDVLATLCDVLATLCVMVVLCRFGRSSETTRAQPPPLPPPAPPTPPSPRPMRFTTATTTAIPATYTA